MLPTLQGASLSQTLEISAEPNNLSNISQTASSSNHAAVSFAFIQNINEDRN